MSEVNETVEPKETTQEPKTYSAEYVKELREEAKQHRLKASETAERLKALEDAKMQEQGQFKELSEKLKLENAELKKQAEKVAEYETRLNQIEEQRKKELLEKLPETLRTEWQDANTDILSKVVKTFETAPKKTHDGGFSGKSQKDYSGAKWDDLTTAELEELKKTNPDIYNKIYKTKYGK